MIIRKANLKDIPYLIELGKGMVNYHIDLANENDKIYEKRNKDAKKNWKKFLNKSIKDRNSLVLIAQDNNKYIAYSIALIKKNIPVFFIKKYGHIYDLYVDKKYRSKGVGRKLMNKTKEFLKKKKIKFISLEVIHNNSAAIKFYENYGFKEYHKIMRMRI